MSTMIYDFMIDRCGGNISFMLMEGTYVFVFTLQEWTSQFTIISNNTMFVSVSLSLSFFFLSLPLSSLRVLLYAVDCIYFMIFISIE